MGLQSGHDGEGGWIFFFLAKQKLSSQGPRHLKTQKLLEAGMFGMLVLSTHGSFHALIDLDWIAGAKALEIFEWDLFENLLHFH